MSERPNPIAEAVFSVEGMHCGACTARVERALQGVDGVEDVEVFLTPASARVRWVPTLVSADALVAAVAVAGYTMRVPEGLRGPGGGAHPEVPVSPPRPDGSDGDR